MAAMSDAGLKGTTLYHNATPAELYEKVRVNLLASAVGAEQAQMLL